VSEELIRHYMTQDRLAATLGIELVDVGPGQATTRLTIDERHRNSAGIVHGGTVFSLADVAFAAASNSGGTLALALDVSITFLRAVSTGTLAAHAEEESCQGRIGCYSIRVEDGDGGLVALFRGTVYRKKTPLAELLSGSAGPGEGDR
jgi:acyl-CoA thioesterase